MLGLRKDLANFLSLFLFFSEFVVLIFYFFICWGYQKTYEKKLTFYALYFFVLINPTLIRKIYWVGMFIGLYSKKGGGGFCVPNTLWRAFFLTHKNTNYLANCFHYFKRNIWIFLTIKNRTFYFLEGKFWICTENGQSCSFKTLEIHHFISRKKSKEKEWNIFF